MAYRLQRQDDSLLASVRRVARQAMLAAVRTIEERHADTDLTIHTVRKCCKKVRAVVRLVRPGLPCYREQDAALRQLARPLAPMRDAAVLVASYDRIADLYAGQINRRALGSIRRRLTLRRQASAGQTDLGSLLAGCRDQLLAAAECPSIQIPRPPCRVDWR